MSDLRVGTFNDVAIVVEPPTHKHHSSKKSSKSGVEQAEEHHAWDRVGEVLNIVVMNSLSNVEAIPVAVREFSWVPAAAHVRIPVLAGDFIEGRLVVWGESVHNIFVEVGFSEFHDGIVLKNVVLEAKKTWHDDDTPESSSDSNFLHY